ncbi:MAG: homogentisate phytyltransferase [Synechococcus sp.]
MARYSDAAKTIWLFRLKSFVSKKLLAIWQFSRPHTIYGTTASLLGIYLLALNQAVLSNRATWLPHGLGLAIALVACLCANVYIVGLNQLFDVQIDRINKPHLPLASGALTWGEGFWIVVLTGAAGLAIAVLQNPYLFATVVVSSAIGTAYSLPPIRLKRFPFFASFCIYTVRGLVVNIGLYFYFLSIQSLPPQITLQLWMLVGFVLVFTLAIALFKDIPDMDGDRRFNVATVSILLGAKQTFHICLWLLTIAYGGVAIAAGWLGEMALGLLVIGHGIAVAGLWWYRYRLPSWNSKDVYDYYQLIWKLFYLEYLLFPLTYLISS